MWLEAHQSDRGAGVVACCKGRRKRNFQPHFSSLILGHNLELLYTVGRAQIHKTVFTLGKLRGQESLQ